MKDQRGSIGIICAGLIVVLALAGFGMWGILRTWRFKIETQFRLDHQVAREALSLQRSLRLVEASNQRMSSIREAAMAGAAALTPAALAAIRAELEVERLFQEAARIGWEAEKVRWMVSGSRMSIARWDRLPEDSIGAQPFTWSDQAFEIGARSGPRSAAALLSAKGDLSDETFGSSVHEWRAEWTNFY